jgi:hypothetical protein
MSKVSLGNQEQAVMMLQHFPGMNLMEEQRIVDK